MKTAVIIKGNPKFIANNLVTEKFYQELKVYLESLGYQVSFDEGLPETLPPKADLWVGHSRGVDRFRFAPVGTKLIALGSDLFGSINHPKDLAFLSGNIPDKYHYVLTKEMKNKIRELVE